MEAYTTIKKKIVSNGFLLLHEIDTDQIVSKHGVDIPPLKQLLFFEPKYISQIMERDYLAINDIPLKFVIAYLDDNVTSISYQNPVKNLSDYDMNCYMNNDLLGRINNILNF